MNMCSVRSGLSPHPLSVTECKIILSNIGLEYSVLGLSKDGIEAPGSVTTKYLSNYPERPSELNALDSIDH